MATVSQIDIEYHKLGLEHVAGFLEKTAERLRDQSGRLLEIGPQDHASARQFFHKYRIDILDIVDTYKPTFIGDITRKNDFLADDQYDCVVCMDVIEHCLNPFAAIQELRRVLRHEGFLLVSAPLNFRIHGPIPDCWRFTEHGFKVLLRDFDILEIDILEAPGRDLFPVHYNRLARNNKLKRTADADLKFRFID